MNVPQRTYFYWLTPLFIALALATAGWLIGWPVRLDVGATTDTGVVQGFHDREQGSFGNYRWSGAQATLTLPAVRSPAVLTICMAGPTIESHPTISIDGRWHVPVTLPATQLRSYRLLIGAPPAQGVHTITLHGVPFTSTADLRPLLALVDTVELRSTTHYSVPPIIPLLLLALISLLVNALVQVLGASHRIAAIVSSLVGGGFAIGWGLWALWVAPFLLPIGVSLTIVTLLFWGLRRAYHAPDVSPALLLFAGIAVTAGSIPLYGYLNFGLDSWLHWLNLPILLIPLGLLLPHCTPQLRRWLAGIILLVACSYGAGMIGRSLLGDFSRDFYAIQRGMHDYLVGEAPLYRLELLQRNPFGDLYKYPPMFAVWMLPLGRMFFAPAFLIWRIFNTALALSAVGMLVWVYRIPVRSWAMASLILLISQFRAITDTLGYGQLDILLLFLLTVGVVGIIRQRFTLVGVMIGIATAFKLYPAYCMGMLLVRKRWYALIGALGAGLVLVAISLVVFGPELHVVFLRDVLPLTGKGTAWVENQTLNGFVNRLLSPEAITLAPDTGGPVTVITYLWAALITLMTLWRTRLPGGMAEDVGYGLWIVAMLLILPVAWFHYAAVLLIPLVQLVVRAERATTPWRWPLLACYCSAWLLLGQGNQWTFFDRTLYGPFWQLLLSYKFFGLLLFFGTIGSERRT